MPGGDTLAPRSLPALPAMLSHGMLCTVISLRCPSIILPSKTQH